MSAHFHSTRTALLLLLAFQIGLGIKADGATRVPQLPARPVGATGGSELVRRFTQLDFAAREQAIASEVFAGNVPDFFRKFCAVCVTNAADGRTNVAIYHVAPDYLAVGSEEDYFLVPLTPVTAQRIADWLGCSLPTRKMVNDIYAAAEVKLAPSPIPPGPQMISVPVFAEHSAMVRTQRMAQLAPHPAGALVTGDKKDVVITARLTNSPGKVAIYGWHRTNGAPIQPLYLGHTDFWVDYSHGIRLVQQKMSVNGKATTVAEVLADPTLAALLSDEGVVAVPRYPTNSFPSPLAAMGPILNSAGTNSPSADATRFKPSGGFGELVSSFEVAPDARVHVNVPAPASFAPEKTVLLIFYALPNGNTTAQTIGRKLKPGDDWHFDIQHIGAQTRFLRELVTNRAIVVAYLEATMKSWPAWRKKHGDALIPGIVTTVRQFFPSNSIEVVLTGHSGGGSFTFGYLNAVERIPDDVTRIAFLDSNYAYTTSNHLAKFVDWLEASTPHNLCVLAYDDANALLDGKPFVSAQGGTWGRSHAMLADLGGRFQFTRQTRDGLEVASALDGRIQFLLKSNPERKIFHTVQVERNGFIHAMVAGTLNEGRGYEYFGERAYPNWISDQ